MPPVPNGLNLPIPLLLECLDDVFSLSGNESEDNAENDFHVESCNKPQQFSLSELNDLIRDLALTKDAVQLLGTRLQEKNLFISRTSFYWFRNREKDFVPCFSQDDELI